MSLTPSVKRDASLADVSRKWYAAHVWFTDDDDGGGGGEWAPDACRFVLHFRLGIFVVVVVDQQAEGNCCTVDIVQNNRGKENANEEDGIAKRSNKAFDLIVLQLRQHHPVWYRYIDRYIWCW